jgi:acyl carrier protein
MRFFEEPRTEECWCRLTVRTIDDTLVADVDIHEPDGCLLVSFEGLYFKLVSRDSWHDLAAVDKATSASDGSSVSEQDGFSQRFSQAAPAIRRLLVLRLVDDLTRELLGRAANETLDPNMGFFDAGMNSLGAVMLCNRLQEALHRPLPITLAFSYSTPGQLAEYLCDDVLGVQAAAHEQPSLDTVACELTARIEDSSEEQLAVRLAHQLKQLHGGAANDS